MHQEKMPHFNKQLAQGCSKLTRTYLVRLIKMCVSLRTSAKQTQIISGRNKLSRCLTLSFSCQFVMLKKKWLQPQRRQRLRILVDSSILRANFVVRGLLLLLAQHREGLVLKSTPHCDGELSRSTRNSWAIVLECFLAD